MENISIKEYFNSLKKEGRKVLMGWGDYFWTTHEKFSVIRFPEFCTSESPREEIDNVFKTFKCIVINYTIIPANKNLRNSILYNCYNNRYEFNKLSKNVRRDIRIGEKNLRVGFINWDEILTGGLKAFSDTRKRVELSDGTYENFKDRFEKFSKIPAHKAVAAWSGEKIAAFMSLIIVDDYVIIQGSFSTDEHKRYCPNNLISDFVLNYFLNENNYNIVCYGLSTIQKNTGSESLHQYKIRIGFEGIPVQRVFLLHPLIKPYEGLLKNILNLIIKFFPHSRFIRKASGLFKQE